MKWNKVSDGKPSGVVLLAIDSYDCGWVMDTGWWYNKKQCWMCTGTNKPLHMDYTHWMELPPNPDSIVGHSIPTHSFTEPRPTLEPEYLEYNDSIFDRLTQIFGGKNGNRY